MPNVTINNFEEFFFNVVKEPGVVQTGIDEETNQPITEEVELVTFIFESREPNQINRFSLPDASREQIIELIASDMDEERLKKIATKIRPKATRVKK